MDGGLGSAIWAFQGDGAGQVAAREGEALRILARSNPEWWYVRTEAGEGYMPASYIQLGGGDVGSEEGSVASTSAVSTQSSVESTTLVQKPS